MRIFLAGKCLEGNSTEAQNNCKDHRWAQGYVCDSCYSTNVISISVCLSGTKRDVTRIANLARRKSMGGVIIAVVSCFGFTGLTSDEYHQTAIRDGWEQSTSRARMFIMIRLLRCSADDSNRGCAQNAATHCKTNKGSYKTAPTQYVTEDRGVWFLKQFDSLRADTPPTLVRNFKCAVRYQ